MAEEKKRKKKLHKCGLKLESGYKSVERHLNTKTSIVLQPERKK